MVAENFQHGLDFVWRPENDGQGYHIDPGDTGGATNHGVILATWRTAVGLGLVEGSLKDAPTDDLAKVLRVMFWNAVQCDHMPMGVDVALFNAAMATGPGRGAKLLQATLGVTADGMIGPKTLAAAQTFDPAFLVKALTVTEEKFYATCPTAYRYLRGWNRRANDCQSFALALIK